MISNLIQCTNRGASVCWRSVVVCSAAVLCLSSACERSHTSTMIGSQTAHGAGTAHDRISTDPVYLPPTDEAVVSFSVWFQVGSMDDPKGKEGLAWVTGELLAEGGTTANSYKDIVAKLYPMAASYSVRVDREMTVLTGRGHRDHIEPFFELFSDAYLKPAFSKADFERIRSDAVSLLEKRLRYAWDEELGKAALQDFIFKGTSYQHPVAGTVEGLNSLTVDDVSRFYREHYTRERAVFGLGGGYTDALVKRMNATRAQLPADMGAPRGARPKPEPIRGRQVLLVSKPGADASISFGFPSRVSRGSKDYYALWIATSWLGEHRNSSSHLYQVIRQARGLNYGDYAYIEAFPEGGFRQKPPVNVARNTQIFEIWIRTLPNENAIFALRAALREYRSLVDNGMTAKQFEATRTFVRKYTRHFAPSTQNRLGYAIDDRFYGIDGSHLDNFVQMMNQLTLDDVNQAIRKHWQYENLKIAIVTGEPEALRSQLISSEPSSVKYPAAKSEAILQEDKRIGVEPLGIDDSRVEVRAVDTMFQR